MATWLITKDTPVPQSSKVAKGQVVAVPDRLIADTMSGGGKEGVDWLLLENASEEEALDRAKGFNQ